MPIMQSTYAKKASSILEILRKNWPYLENSSKYLFDRNERFLYLNSNIP